MQLSSSEASAVEEKSNGRSSNNTSLKAVEIENKEEWEVIEINRAEQDFCNSKWLIGTA